MLPAWNAELTMILATQFQEGVETVLAHWHAGYKCSANVSCSYIHETHNGLQSCHYSQRRPYSWNHEFSRDCQSQALKDPRNNVEGDSACSSQGDITRDRGYNQINLPICHEICYKSAYLLHFTFQFLCWQLSEVQSRLEIHKFQMHLWRGDNQRKGR